MLNKRLRIIIFPNAIKLIAISLANIEYVE